MWKLPIRLVFVDGAVLLIDAADWESVRGEGVDRLEFPKIQRAGDSLYYLRAEGMHVTDAAGSRVEPVWVCGAFSPFDGLVEESIMRQGGEVLARRRRTLPDLRRNQLKLGWWRDGADRPATD